MNVEAVLADEVYSDVELGTYLTCMGDELPYIEFPQSQCSVQKLLTKGRHPI